MAKYGKKAQRKIAKVMREWKAGQLKSGRSKRRVTSRKQAVAIGLSEARRSGAKVPKRRPSKTRRARPKSRPGASRKRTRAKKGA
jgi:hypothetical protein